MMDIEEVIQRIIDNGRIEDMHELSDILEDTMEEIKKYDRECYDKYAMKLYKMAYGNTFTRKMAEEIVSKMRPVGRRWSIEDIQHIQEQYGLENIPTTSIFIVMNSAYNDYRDLFGDELENYIKFTVDFIHDEDAKPDKVFMYYTTLVE